MSANTDPKSMTRNELIAECRRRHVTPKGGLSRATRGDLEMWIAMNPPRRSRRTNADMTRAADAAGQ